MDICGQFDIVLDEKIMKSTFILLDNLYQFQFTLNIMCMCMCMCTLKCSNCIEMYVFSIKKY